MDSPGAGKCRKKTLAVLGAIVLSASWSLARGRRTSAPPAGTPSSKSAEPSPQEKAYRERADSNPQDARAFHGMATLQVRRGDFADAIASYRRVLELTPRDHDASVGLGRALAFDGQYEAALRSFEELLQKRPDDTDALEGMARTQLWSGHPEAALPVFQNLKTLYPANPDYALGLARAQMALHRDAEARKTLNTFVTAQPRNRDAQLQLAYLSLYEGHQAEAWRRFNRLIRQDPTNTEALLGNVRIAYYRGDLAYARNLAAQIVADDSRNFDALLLLANVERALHRRRQAWTLLQRAKALEPRNPEAQELETSLRSDARPTLHTAASYSREISTGDPSSTEDLTAFGYENTWGFFTLPRSEAYLSLGYLPSQSPSGGVQGAVAPSQVLYRQTTYLTPQLTVRGGVGLVRFGPGEISGIPTQPLPITAATARPLGFGGVSYAWSKKLTVDFTASRAAVTLTPTAVRLGVMENRLALGLDYRFNTKTVLCLEPFTTDDATIRYTHDFNFAGSSLEQVGSVDHNRNNGATVTMERALFRRRAVSLDVGYAGLAYEIAGGLNKPYLGFFNPSFYQRHYLTAHVWGKIWRPLGYDFSAGAGVQQIERSTPIKPALLLTPAFTLRASARLALTLSYTHYDSSQSLGVLRGNAVRLSTDWKF